MRKPQAYILSELIISRYCKCLSQPIPIILQHFNNAIFFIQGSGAAFVIDGRIKHCRYHKFRHFLLHQAPILYRFRNAGCSKYSMELSTATIYKPFLFDIRNNTHDILFCLVLFIRNKIFNTLYPLITDLLPIHFHLGRIHPFVEDLLFLLIFHYVFYCFSLGFFQSHLLSELIIVIYLDHIRIKTKNIFIPDAIRQRISVNLASENGCCGAVLLDVDILYRRAGKTENDGMLEGIFYRRQHLTKSRTVTFIYDYDQPLRPDFL